MNAFRGDEAPSLRDSYGADMSTFSDTSPRSANFRTTADPQRAHPVNSQQMQSNSTPHSPRKSSEQFEIYRKPVGGSQTHNRTVFQEDDTGDDTGEARRRVGHPNVITAENGNRESATVVKGQRGFKPTVRRVATEDRDLPVEPRERELHTDKRLPLLPPMTPMSEDTYFDTEPYQSSDHQATQAPPSHPLHHKSSSEELRSSAPISSELDPRYTTRTEGTTVHETVKPAVTEEIRHRQITEIEHPVITRDIHVNHYYEYIQPIKVVEIARAKHYAFNEQGEKVQIPTPDCWECPEWLTERTIE